MNESDNGWRRMICCSQYYVDQITTVTGSTPHSNCLKIRDSGENPASTWDSDIADN